MRIAVFHDQLEAVGGGEKVALTLAKHLGADLVTCNVDPHVQETAGFEGVNVVSLGSLLHGSPYKHIHASWKFGRCRLRGYDFHIFIGNMAQHAAKAHHPNMYYCLTPMRAFYDQKDAIVAKQSLVYRGISDLWIGAYSMIDQYAVRQCDRVIAISENVRGRVKRFYDIDSDVVYPPVATSRFRFTEVGDYWLSVCRLYPEKRIELQFEAFRLMPRERLVIAGGYSKADRMERYVESLNPPPNVTILGEVNQGRLADLYARCRGFLTTAVDEDFGLTPVEAMAAGKCVLAADEGGYRESVVNGKTGFLLPPEPEAFAAKIGELDDSTLKSMKDDCAARAKAFDESVFLKRMQGAVESGVSR